MDARRRRPLPQGQRYALLFGGWVAITEIIPYLGPWLGAIPPFLYALVVHPISALWVALLFLGIHQIEGHIVVPNVMGNALRLHPLLVIFGLAAGTEIYGLPGALIALPFLASCRAIWEFFVDRIHFEPWSTAEPSRRWRSTRRPAAGGERPEMTLLTARGVSRAFGRRVALRPTDLDLVEGEVVALVGPNGAGKSTLLSILAGALEPTPARSSGTPRVGWVPQRSAHYGRLTARENLGLFGSLEAASASRVDELLADFELPDDVRAGELSIGNRQRLDVAIALIGSPEVLLLDEPTASLDPAQRRRLWQIAQDVREHGGSVLVATHHWDELSGHADRTLELVDGELQ